MVRVAICDDEKNIRSYLSWLIRQQEADCRITEYASAEEYLADNREHDLVFLDIEIGGSGVTDGERKAEFSERNGLWLAREICRRESAKQPILIFVTGYEQYVYDAFDVNAFHYLIKPVNEQKFAEVFRRAVGFLSAEEEQRKRSLVVQYGNDTKTIPLSHIYYIESQGHKAALHMKKGELLYYAKLDDLEQELLGQFYRIHKGYVINLAYVEGYNRTTVTLATGQKLLISKYRYEGFVKAYMEYISEGGG